MKSARSWCFTINNPSDSDYSQLSDLQQHVQFQYMIYQLEKESTEHIQGYVQFRSSIRRKQVSGLLTRASLRPARGSQSQNISYCSKSETRLSGPFVFGTPKNQGKRTDLDEVISDVKQGRTIHQIALDHPKQFIHYHSGIKAYKFEWDRSSTKDWREVEVAVFYGETGTSKTRNALEYATSRKLDYYMLDMANKVWFDGYGGEPLLIIDDFYGWIPCGHLLRLLDGYQCRLEIRCGFTWAKWTKVVITSNKHPFEWYKEISNDQQAALKRRLDSIFFYQKDKDPIDETDSSLK